MNILLAYFSATNNTARIAEAISERLAELGAAKVDLLDITTPERRVETPDMTSYQAAVFGSPIHYMRAPRVVREWLSRLEGRGTPCALFFTYGGFQVHPAHKTTAEILTRNGFRVTASAEFLGKHTYNLVGWQAMMDRPDEFDLEVAREYADLIYRRFSAEAPEILGDFPDGKVSTAELDKRETSIPRLFPRLPGREGAQCGMCMLCEEMCPTGAMNAERGQADPELCMLCLRCIEVCPEEVNSFLDLTDFFHKKMDMDSETPESLRNKKSKIYQ